MVFTRAQALALGVGGVRLAGLVRRAYVVRIRKGVYARAEVPVEQAAARLVQASTAAMAQRRGTFVLSHLSAAAAWDLPLGNRHAGHLTDVGRLQRSRKVAGLVIHHADSSVTDVTETMGVPVTSAARTVADCLRGFGSLTSVPIADAALHRGLVSIDEVVVQLAMQCHWDGSRRGEVSLQLVDGRRESWLESYALVRFAQWGIDLPEPQVTVLDEAGWFVARTDGGWLEDATVLELDGKAKYQMPGRDGHVDPMATWEAEKQRFDRVGNLGLERVRFGLTDLLQDHCGCGSRYGLGAGLARASASPAASG